MSLVRFYVKIVSENSGWQVAVHKGDLSTSRISHHQMRKLPAASGQVFPQLSMEDVPATAPDAVKKLCNTTESEDVRQIFSRISNRTQVNDDVSVFGQYLFASLLGATAWTAILTEAGNEGVELALYWAETERDLSRLPWEMMRQPGAASFLANDPARMVAVTRIVAGTTQVAKPIELPLRVLFAIGSDMSDERIRPGAEYLGLLQHLKLNDQVIEVDHHLLTAATPDDMKKEVGEFKPDVVHLICHGDGETLELRNDRGEPTWFSANQIIDMLKPAGVNQLPGVVVLNACYTANGKEAAQVSGPLAMQLVEAGVPIVVGMGGEVADDACRLFTAGFYTALVKGKSLPEATAEARRKGLLAMGQADRLVDWALPTLFMAEKADPKPVVVDTAAAQQRRKLYEFARQIPVTADPPVFCDRTEILSDYRHLVDPGHTHKVVAAKVVDGMPLGSLPGMPAAQYGKTRLLSELARRAQRDGHVPCFCQFSEQTPDLVFELLLLVFESTRQARMRIGLPEPAGSAVLDLIDSALTTTNQGPSNKADTISQRMMTLKWRAKNLGSNGPKLLQLSSPGEILKALSSDLIDLEQEAQAHYPGARVLVLLDDVHKFGEEAARGFAVLLDSPYGWGTGKQHPVPVIFAFSNVSGESTQAATALEAMLQNGPSSVVVRRLAQYPEPTKDFTLYSYLLLHHEPRLVVASDAKFNNPSQYTAALSTFWKLSRGIPSWLVLQNNPHLEVLIDYQAEAGVWRPATDDDEMKIIFP